MGSDTQLLTPPYPLPDPVSPQPLVAAGTGALVGLLVAGGVVVVVLVGARRRTKSLRARLSPPHQRAPGAKLGPRAAAAALRCD